MAIQKPQRYRINDATRTFYQEFSLKKSDFILPLFINESLSGEKEIKTLPGVKQFGLNSVLSEIERACNLGISAVILFGIPKSKDKSASEAFNPKGVIQKAISRIKKSFPHLIVIADCCLCEYTDHGNCYIHNHNHINFEETLVTLGEIAVSYAKAGADIIAPSGMIDGKVSAIRKALDKQNFPLVSIMSYAVKYASAFYGPFRDATDASDCSIDRRHHQMNPSQRLEAQIECDLDLQEGADSIIVKPISHYLDIVRDLKVKVNVPLIGYHVSGEYAMLKYAAQQGIVDEESAFQELYLSLKRAGCSKIISYYAKEMVGKL